MKGHWNEIVANEREIGHAFASACDATEQRTSAEQTQIAKRRAAAKKARAARKEQRRRKRC